MPTKEKQKRKTKEEIVAEAKAQAEAYRQRAFVKDTLWNFLLSHADSIKDARDMCEMADMYIQQAFSRKITESQRGLSKEKTSILEIDKEPTIGTKTYKNFKELIQIISNEEIAVATSLLGGMAKAIDSFVKEETTKRKLETLKPTFL